MVKLKIFKEELFDVKRELEDVKKEFNILKDDSVKSYGHTNITKNSEVISKETVDCNDCENSFQSKKDLKKHIQASHVRVAKWKECKENMEKNSDLEEHNRKSYPERNIWMW